MVVERTLAAPAPDEGCALLLGRHLTSTLDLLAVWPCRNQWEAPDERSRRFSIDPREQLLAQRWCRSRGLSVLGAAHSHPSSDAVPSATDLELSVGPTLMLIRSGLQQGPAALRAWWVHGLNAFDSRQEKPKELTITLKLAAAGAEDLGE